MYIAQIITDSMSQSNGYIIAQDVSLYNVRAAVDDYISDCVSWCGWRCTPLIVDHYELSAYDRTITLGIRRTSH